MHLLVARPGSETMLPWTNSKPQPVNDSMMSMPKCTKGKLGKSKWLDTDWILIGYWLVGNHSIKPSAPSLDETKSRHSISAAACEIPCMAWQPSQGSAKDTVKCSWTSERNTCSIYWQFMLEVPSKTVLRPVPSDGLWLSLCSRKNKMQLAVCCGVYAWRSLSCHGWWGIMSIKGAERPQIQTSFLWCDRISVSFRYWDMI